MKLKPEILCQPNVPTPLHGMAPGLFSVNRGGI